ncbi:MAG TPA: AAA family ATPase [Candidatus Tectomicrobia bacterium]|nr:AAA family ATPase [Candidatus Tectomicrobia bacterium]
MQPTDLVKALSQPEAYPDRPAEVTLRQTHISWLFFTEQFVYKVKKPVNFGFLDFTTLEARRHFCEEEARLNRRLAADVYLGVLEVKAVNSHVRLGGPGETIDYALQMRRLPEDRMLPALLASGDVTPGTMRRLARLLAGFHGQAATGGEIDHDGTLAVILKNWQENFAQTQPYLDFPLRRDAYEKIRSRVLAFCRVRQSLFDQRIAEGRIRDGHGDLRAEHICLTEPIAIFDCIEFNHRFRYADVASDVAFLAMDLDERGFANLSRAFVQAYIEHSGDHGLLSVLDFYKCYRAFVRAKVECFRLADPTLSPTDKRRAFRAAYGYCELAAGYADALRRPCLVLCCGLMGSGKSVLADALAQRLNVEVLSSDVMRKELAGLQPMTPSPDAYGQGLYSAERTEATYARLLQRAECLLARGQSVLLDASFQRSHHRAQAMQIAARLGAEFYLLECWCPEEELRRRLEARVARGDSISDGRWELLAQQKRAFEPLLEVPPEQHLRVDTTRTPQVVVEEVVRQLVQRSSLAWCRVANTDPSTSGREANSPPE